MKHCRLSKPTTPQANKFLAFKNSKKKEIVNRSLDDKAINDEQQNSSCNFHVVVKIKPLLSHDSVCASVIQQVTSTQISVAPQFSKKVVSQASNCKHFNFSHVFSGEIPTQTVFSTYIQHQLPSLLKGLNVSIFAYGVTGSGKTYTMFGNLLTENDLQTELITQEKGVILCSLEFVLKLIKELKVESLSVKMAFLEVYNERIKDLLQANSEDLEIREDCKHGILVEELEFLKDVIKLGNTRRTTGETKSNQFSSRSHAVLMFKVEQEIKINSVDVNDKQISQVIEGRLVFCDLAGSERAAIANNTGLRQKEGQNINKSLLALGNCINSLSKQENFIPYRDSKLTRLLKESLGGNSISIMIACISPAYSNYEETLNTLKYAQRATTIKKNLSQQIVEKELKPAEYKQIITELQKEIDNLKAQMNVKRSVVEKSGKKINSNKKQLSISPQQQQQQLPFPNIQNIIHEKNTNLQQQILLNQQFKELQDQILAYQQQNQSYQYQLIQVSKLLQTREGNTTVTMLKNQIKQNEALICQISQQYLQKAKQIEENKVKYNQIEKDLAFITEFCTQQNLLSISQLQNTQKSNFNQFETLKDEFMKLQQINQVEVENMKNTIESMKTIITEKVKLILLNFSIGQNYIKQLQYKQNRKDLLNLKQIIIFNSLKKEKKITLSQRKQLKSKRKKPNY